MSWITGGGIPAGAIPLCGWPSLGIPGKLEVSPLGVAKFVTRALAFYLLILAGFSGQVVSRAISYRIQTIADGMNFIGEADAYKFTTKAAVYNFVSAKE